MPSKRVVGFWVLAGVIGCPLAAFAAAPDAAAEFVDDLWNTRRYERQTISLREEHLRLHRTLRDVKDRIALKEYGIESLIAGRQTFEEVAELYLLLGPARDGRYAAEIERVPGATEAQKAAYGVLKYLSLHDGPAATRALADAAAAYEARFGRAFPEK